MDPLTFNIPRLPKSYLSRQRLLEKMDDTLALRFLVVDAATGYGATTLVADWCRARNAENEVIPVWFTAAPHIDMLSSFAKELHRAAHCIDGLAETISETAQVDLHQQCQALLGGLSDAAVQSGMHLVVVIDEYERSASDDGFVKAFDELMDAASPHTHFVLIAHDTTRLPLARHRTAGRCGLLSVVDLAFTAEEARLFIQKSANCELTDEEAATLHALTYGWLPNLQLVCATISESSTVRSAFESLRNGTASPVLRFVEETLEALPLDSREFFTRCIRTTHPDRNMAVSAESNSDLGKWAERLYASYLIGKDSRNQIAPNPLLDGFLRRAERAEDVLPTAVFSEKDRFRRPETQGWQDTPAIEGHMQPFERADGEKLEQNVSDVLQLSLGTVPFVARRKCFEEFERLRSWPISFVYAPKGFGKTTALAAWAIEKSKAPESWRFTWISLEEDAARNVQLLAKQVRNALRNTGSAAETFAVIDMFELIADTDFAIELVSLGLTLPKESHLVFISSREPMFDRLGVTPFFDCNVINADALSFSEAETEAAYDALNVPSAQRNTQEIVEKFQGWPFKFFCEMAIVRNPSARGEASRAISSSLGSLLKTLSTEDVRFLKQTAFLDRFSKELCDYIFGSGSAETELESLRRSGLIVCENRGWWHIYLPLREYLLENATISFTPEIHTRFRRAYTWLAQHGYRVEAARQLLLSGNLSDPLSVTRAVLPDRKRLDSDIERKILTMPLTSFAESPNVCIVTAWAFLFAGNGEEALFWIERLESACKRLDAGSETRAAFENMIPCLKQKAFVFLGNPGHSIRIGCGLLENADAEMGTTAQALVRHALGEAYELDGQLDNAFTCFESAAILSSIEESPTLAAYIQYDLIWHVFRAGKTSDAAKQCKEALTACPKNLPIFAGLRFLDTLLKADQGDLADIDSARRECGASLSPLHNPDLYLDAGIAHARSLVMQGQESAALKALMKMMGDLHGLRIPRGALSAAGCERVELTLSVGLASDARAALHALESSAPSAGIVGANYLSYARACAAFAESRFDEALTQAEAIIQRTDGTRLHRFALRAMVLRACIFAEQGLSKHVEESLVSALRACQKAGTVYPFVLYRKILQPHIFALASSRNLDYLSLAHAKLVLLQISKASHGAFGSQESALTSLLTKKEQEILYLLCLGYSRAEMARALTLSLNTVKTHLNRIYAKLGVHTNAEAVAMAHDGGLVSNP